jgi:hypothetical protein
VRTDIESDGPNGVVIMAHGFAALKEMGLESFAERFVEAATTSTGCHDRPRFLRQTPPRLNAHARKGRHSPEGRASHGWASRGPSFKRIGR